MEASMQQAVPTILQVEDEENIRKLLTVNLVQRGYNVVEAFTGEQGLEEIRNQTPDLLILNIRLPDMSGLDILDQLKDDSLPPSNFPAIIITAFVIDTQSVLRQYPRVAKIFTKPFDVKEVIEFIQQILPVIKEG
jgi:DNA-binding response OmpR family regulator